MQVTEENRNKILIFIVVGVLLWGLIRITFFEKKEFEYDTETDPLEMVDLSIDLENEFGLDNVMITEAEEGVLEIRMETPPDVSQETLLVGSASVFGFVEPYVSGEIKKIRIIFTVNYLDAMFLEVDSKNIEKWLDRKADDEEFVGKFRIVKLTE